VASGEKTTRIHWQLATAGWQLPRDLTPLPRDRLLVRPPGRLGPLLPEALPVKGCQPRGLGRLLAARPRRVVLHRLCAS
jgi:hypothetical protein